jgi:hypothetical protein
VNGILSDSEQMIRSSRKKAMISLIVVSVGLHVLVALGAGVWVVVRYFNPPEAVFVARKTVMIPAQIIDPKMAGAELEGASSRPALDDRLSSLRETEFALPDLPKVSVDQMMSFDPSAVLTDSASGFGAGMGSGGGGNGDGSGGGGEGAGFSFFGIQSEAKSIIIIFDISLSVLNKAQKAGIPITKIQEETMKLIDGLSINTKFNLIQFSRIYQPMATEMQSPSDTGKTMAKNWLNKEFRTDGALPRSVKGARAPMNGKDSGICFVLDGALTMRPDVIFLISDASFQSDLNAKQVPWKEVEDVIQNHENSGVKTRINFIGFEMKSEDKKEMRSLVRKTEGTLKEIGTD